jgi:hypothetical protein
MSLDNRSTKIKPVSLDMKAEAQKVLLNHINTLESGDPKKVMADLKVSQTEAYIFLGTLHQLKEAFSKRLAAKEKKSKVLIGEKEIPETK